MIPFGVRVFLASQPVDFRKGPDSLLSLVRDGGHDPFSGARYSAGHTRRLGTVGHRSG